jgi:hypothetical protein
LDMEIFEPNHCTMATAGIGKERIAIDVGGVLIEKKDKSGPDTNFDVDNIRWMQGALDAVKSLSQHFDLYILSFCGKKTELETREALRTCVIEYIPESKWIFTRDRTHKVPRMQELDITTLVDDTWQIISSVENAGLRGIHYGSWRFSDWTAIVNHLTKDMPSTEIGKVAGSGAVVG